VALSTFPSQWIVAQQNKPPHATVLSLTDTLFWPLTFNAVYLLRPVCHNTIQEYSVLQLCYYTEKVLEGGSIPATILGVGTHFLATELPPDDTICSILPVYEQFGFVHQVTIHRDTTYLGYLEELLHIPFVLPPRHISGYGHQTDLRLASDCAETAIYGRRRQGYHVPYVGPKGILNYLQKADCFAPGVVLHFGHQVSVLYEDLGIPGKLDAEDILLHAYTNKVELIPLGFTNLLPGHCQIMMWR